MTEAEGQNDTGRKEESAICRQLDALEHREEPRRKYMAMFEREIAHLEDVKARMVDADAETCQEIIKRLLISAMVETAGTGRG